jgi:citrate lyase subunit beta/citryl-CoA lyase
MSRKSCKKGGYEVMARSEAGRRGKDVRSDCWISIETTTEGGISFEITSKVESMYGASVRQVLEEGLRFFGIENARVKMEDLGALPFAMMARLETAIRRLDTSMAKEYLPELAPECTYATTRERMRRSRLYLPGNDPKFMINAGIHKPDGVILDLEDSVHPGEKDAARIMVRNALRQVDFMGAERMVRINQGEMGLLDLEFVIPHNVHVVLIPGLEDYTADIGTRRTPEGRESFWARSQIVNAARAARVQPIDTVFSDVRDMEGLRESVLEAKSLGFDGKGCIHPRQIRVIHEAFAPGDAEIERAKEIVLAFEAADAKGLGVVSLGSKMIDPPVVKRALHTVQLAIATGKLNRDWRNR